MLRLFLKIDSMKKNSQNVSISVEHKELLANRMKSINENKVKFYTWDEVRKCLIELK